MTSLTPADMDDDIPLYDFAILARWAGRPAAPAAIGEQFMGCLGDLEDIHPAFTRWRLADYVEVAGVPLKYVASDITGLVENNVNCGGGANLLKPKFGYSMLADSHAGAASRMVRLMVTAGSTEWPFNHALFSASTQQPLDKAIVTYPIFRAILDSLVARWSPAWASAYAFRRNPTANSAASVSRWYMPWIIYLAPDLGIGLAPPQEFSPEPSPDGGGVMRAADQRLFLTSANHMARSKALEEILEARASEVVPNYPPERAQTAAKTEGVGEPVSGNLMIADRRQPVVR